jgi:hypothetical protein
MFFYFIVTLHICLVIKKKSISPTSTFEFFQYSFFQHTNNSKSDLINHSACKPPLSMTSTIDTIESTKELEPNKKLLSVHAPFILHDAMVGFFHCCNRIIEPMFSLKVFTRIQVQLPFSLFSQTC